MQRTNQLIHAVSPYLQQHAHNPVHWQMWTNETLALAKVEDKPILVSIGYSSCHWCHVMEKESFEDKATASVMNEHFINIKIDREERPDLDHIYMDAVQAMTGSGGWPLNVFLTPQLKPFYGGTYFPPIAAHGRMSWTDTLLAVSKAYNERKDEIEEQAERLTDYINNSNSFTKKASENNDITEDTLNTIAANILQNADTVWGGFGNAPKFPQTFSIQFLLRHYHYTKDENCLKQALLSLDKMILGGINDQIGGGFARYSTDEKWFAPHFEKMLYDNALLMGVLSDAYQLTNNILYKETIEATLAFIEREMMNSEYAFFSALDADSEGVEGKFYTWSKVEIDELLKDDAILFCELFNVSENGNWEHSNILWLKKTMDEIAAEKNLNVGELKLKVAEWKKILLDERDKKIRPLLDDKVLCNWNCLMNIAYSKAYAATGNEHYKQVAKKNMAFLLSGMYVDGQLMHCYKNRTAYNAAFLDDYVYLIWALIQLQEITGDQNYLLQAKHFMDEVLNSFSDEEQRFFYYTPRHLENIISRKKEVFDSATPSSNAVAAYCLNYLSTVFYDGILRKRFLQMLASLQPAVEKYPTSFGMWAALIQGVLFNNEIVITGIHSNATIPNILSHYTPNKVLLVSEENPNNSIPILSDKTYTSEPLYYLCKNNTCQPPQTSLSKFLHFYNI